MTNDPSNLLAAARSAFPKFAGIFDALSTVIASESAGSDLGKILAGAQPGQRIVLAPGASYVLTGTPVIKADNVSLIGSGNPVAVTPAPGSSSGIVVQGDGCEFAGLHFSGPAVTFRIYGVDPKNRVNPTKGPALSLPKGTAIHDCTFADNMNAGVLLDAWADNVTISNCAFGKTGDDAIYCTADNLQVSQCTFAGSLGEHCIRFDINASTRHRPIKATLASCDMINHNPQGKECLAVRELDGLTVTGCTFDGWVSTGQGPDDGVWHARNIVFFACTWKSLRPGGSLAQFDHDCDITIDSCTVPASATDHAFTLDSRAKLIAVNNTMLVPQGITSKPLAKGDANVMIVENGTKMG